MFVLVVADFVLGHALYLAGADLVSTAKSLSGPDLANLFVLQWIKTRHQPIGKQGSGIGWQGKHLFG